MIKGNIEIFQSYGDEHKSLYKGANMVVDGFRETVADIMTYMPNPSGFGSYMENGVSSVSSYQVQAMTLGSAKEAYSQRSSRFWYSSIESSAANQQLYPPTNNSEFEMRDCFSGIGFNQWKYDNAVDANILGGPTLADGYVGLWYQISQTDMDKPNKWNILYKDTPPEFNARGAIDRSITNQRVTLANGRVNATRFELVRGQEQITLRQQVPELELGGVYTLYTNGRAYNSTMDFRVCRGRNNVPAEYYNFSSGKFVDAHSLDSKTQHTISLPEYFDVDQFKFKLQGNVLDQAFLNNNQYFVEYVFPSRGFVDNSFAPWDSSYRNPYIDLLRLELCDNRHQILKNPNFLDLQSLLLNNDFEITAKFPSTEAANPDACEQEGLMLTPGWTQVNPLARNLNDPQNASGVVGTVRPFKTWHARPNTVFSGSTDGVLLHSSSTDMSASGAAALLQTFNLGDRFKNKYAYPNDTSQTPSLLTAARAQYDNNATLMLAFDSMVSGAATASNSGYLEVSLQRNSDSYFYNFSPDSVSLRNGTFSPLGTAAIFKYSAKDVWEQKGIHVTLPADAQRDSYTLSIKARGRTDTDGFSNYGIKNFRFGPLEGWRTYVYDFSGIANWQLSSSASKVTSGNLFSGLFLSSLSYSGLDPDGSAFEDIVNGYQGINSVAKTQLVQNFVGMEPTKTYRLSVKGTRPDGNTPGLTYQLKAKASCSNNGTNYNVFGQYMRDVNSGAFNFSSNPLPEHLNPYSKQGYTGGLDRLNPQRRTFPSFNMGINSPSIRPTDWGLYVNSSGNPEYSMGTTIGFDTVRANAGTYVLSMEVYNSEEHNSFFALSANLDEGRVYYNWDWSRWDSYTAAEIAQGNVPGYRNDLSGSYFLNLPGGTNTTEFTKYTYPTDIIINEGDFGPPSTDKTPDGEGSRGDYVLGAALFGPNAESGQCLVKNLALRGPGLGPHVDIWKELYYDFTNADWQVTPLSSTSEYMAPDVSTNSLKRKTTVEAFMSCPNRLISNMWAYGLDRDTEYQLNIIDVSGGQTVFHDVSLTDVSLVANEGSSRWIRDADVWTSEPYNNSRYSQYDNGSVFKLWNNYHINSTEATDPSSMSDWDIPGSIMFRNPSGTVHVSAGGSYVPVMRVDNQRDAGFFAWLTQNFTLGEQGLNGGDEFTVGLEAIQPTNTSIPGVSGAIEAIYDNQRYTYNFTSREWIPGYDRRTKGFNINCLANLAADSFLSDMSTWTQIISPVITAPSFGPETKIVVSIITDPRNANLRDMDLKNFKVYGYTNASSNEYHISGTTFNFPEFPQPEDRSLQSVQPSGHPGELGHFLNRINYFNYNVAHKRSFGDVSAIREINNPMAPSPTGETTLEQAITMGAYLPSAGLFFYSGTYGLLNSQQNWADGPYESSAGLIKGTLNEMGVVNSDGYIYRHPTWASVTNMHDASAGFLVSSVSSTIGNPYGGYGKKTLRYILKIHRDDWRFLDYYMGGIGAMGLHTLNYKESYKKLGTAYQISGTGETYSQGSRVPLYNVARPSRNPMFNLANKKVTFPSGLKIKYQDTDYVTIIWDINY